MRVCDPRHRNECPLSVLTFVRIKKFNFLRKYMSFSSEKTKLSAIYEFPYYKWVSVERSGTHAFQNATQSVDGDRRNNHF